MQGGGGECQGQRSKFLSGGGGGGGGRLEKNTWTNVWGGGVRGTVACFRIFICDGECFYEDKTIFISTSSVEVSGLKI